MAETEALVRALDERGYVVLPDLIEEAGREAIRRAVEPLLGPSGRNAFEGVRTQRVYSLLNKTRALDDVLEHPGVLALLDRLLMLGRRPPAATVRRRPTRGDVGRLLRTLHRRAVARRGSQPPRPPADGGHRAVLPTVVAAAGGLQPLD